MFSHFFDKFLIFENFDQKSKRKKQITFSTKSEFLGGRKVKNQKREKTFPRYTYFDGFGNFLVIFFLPLWKKMGQNKFLAISQNATLSQKSDDLNRFLVKFPF